MATEFAAAGCAAILAISLVHPLDVVKSRMQFAGELGSKGKQLGMFSWLARLVRSEGIASLYRGLTAAYGLQFSVTATRFGTYGLAKQLIPAEKRNDGMNVILAGLSGAFGALAGNPFFAIKTRMQVYSTNPELQVGTQHKPEGLISAFRGIYREEGFRGYFRGIDAFIPRVMFYGAAQLASYDAIKARLTRWQSGPLWATQNGFPQHAICGFFAAIVSVTVIQPFDFIAVRMQNQDVDPRTKRGLLYSSPWDCLVKSMRAEGGIKALFKGYPANAIRFGPYTVLVFVFVERFREIFNKGLT